jgi:hypothetical protein
MEGKIDIDCEREKRMYNKCFDEIIFGLEGGRALLKTKPLQ